MPLLTSMFSNDSVEAIMKIRIPMYVKDDTLTWTKSTNGSYTVKFGYEVCRQHNDWGFTESDINLFKRIWKANIYNRHKLFLWRLARGAIMVKEALNLRIASISPICPLCNSHNETVVHLFWSCSMARSVWLKRWGLRTDAIQMNSKSSLVQLFLQPGRLVAESETRNFTNWSIACAENIWKVRNDIIFGGASNVDAIQLSARINRLSLEVSVSNKDDHAHISHGKESLHSQSVLVSQHPCSRRGMVISCDAAIQPSLSMVACVARENDSPPLCFITRSQRSSSPREVEAIAVWEAVRWAKQNNWVYCEFESDSLEVINAIKNVHANSIGDELQSHLSTL